MIKRLFILLLFLVLGPDLAQAGQEIVAVQSIRVTPYEEALEGFRSVCDAKITRLILSEMGRADVVEKIKGIRPDLVLAIGMDSLSKMKRITNIPVVYLMVLNPQSVLSGEENITGVSMNIPQEKQLVTLLEALPDLETVGLLYDPVRTGNLVQRAQVAARKIGIKLIAKEVHSSKEVPSSIKKLKGKIDVFWMIPDVTVASPELIEFLFLFFLGNNIPILTFAEKYVEIGALMSIGVDAFDMGRQAGAMAEEILSGKDVNDVQQVDARKAIISINLKIARKLGITVDEKIIRKARVIN